ncbi:unnamed protein product [Symbiodinium natans]|uniref:Uncharacterized protein n=1 Tax=Symbiodinium natans TaxID=878477 RepID=A0A812UH20_9DINO|nr:unnamed protein product [Symbiodinium natans]
MDCNPPREEERIPRPLGVRGTRGGAAAQRKRKAYQIYIFLRDQDLGIFADPSEVPFRRPDGSTRSVVRRPRTAPFQAVEEQSEVIVIDDQAPETPPPSTPVREDHGSITSTRFFVIKLFNSEAFAGSKAFVNSIGFIVIRHSGSEDSTESSASKFVLHRVPEPSHPPPPQVTGNPRVIDFRPLKTEVLDFEGVKVKLTEPAFERFSFGLSLDFHGVLDRYHKKSTSWTDPRPEFPSECVAALRDLHSLIPRYGGLFFVCSYCHHEDTKRHVVETTVNSCDTLFTQIGESPICLIFITRKATGPLGKRAVLEHLAKEVELPIIHVDDSADVCDELAGSEHVIPLHIAIPKRSKGSRGQRTIFPRAPVPSFDSFPECTDAIRGQVRKWFPDA